MTTIELRVNGRTVQAEVTPRTHLADFLREHLLLTGTHIGCEHGICGACTVLIDGEPARSCLMFAVQADGYAITTVESLAPAPGELGVIQDAFCETHGMQCGFCTSGQIMSGKALLLKNAKPTEAQARRGLSGNLCRCGNYNREVAAVLAAGDGDVSGGLRR